MHDLWGALVHGAAYGVLHVVGPDHLGTLVALSATAAPRRAFWLGATWSLGHCTGMILVAGLFFLAQKVTKLDIKTWEFIGDYAIGVSLVLCGLFFIHKESTYLQEENGNVSLKGCACHGDYGAATQGSRPTARQRQGLRLMCREYNSKPMLGCATSDSNQAHGCTGGHSGEACSSTADSESSEVAVDEAAEAAAPGGNSDVEGTGGAPSPLRAGEASKTAPQAYRAWLNDLSGALLGVMQGLCCPMGMVGIAFLADMPSGGIAIFLITFLLVSALGTGTFSGLWSALVGMRGDAEGKVGTTWWATAMYRSSCAFTVILGVSWIIANACGVLDRLNYTEAHHHHHVRAEAANWPV